MSWPTVPLSRLLQASDSGVWGDEAPQTGISVLRSTNMSNDGTLDFTNLTFRDIPEKKRVAKALRQGDIVLENSGGGPKQPVGRVCFFNGHDIEHVVGNFCRRLRVVGDAVVPKYLFWRLHYGHLIGETLRYQTQTIGLRNLQFRAYVEQSIGLPALSEQLRIVELLDEADHLRRLRREADVKAARILPALFLKMFGDPASNPMGWLKRPLGDLADQRPEYGANASACPRKDDMPRYVRITDIRENGTLSDKEIVSLDSPDWRRYLLHDGDVLFARSGNTVGKTYIYRPDDGPCAFAGYLIRFQFRSGAIDPWFVFGVTQTGYYRGWVESHKRVAGQPNINGQEYSALLIPEPPQTLQKKFGMLAQEVERVLAEADIAAEQLEASFSNFLLNAFSGRLTAKWREGHMKELLAEMSQQARALNLPTPKELEALS